MSSNDPPRSILRLSAPANGLCDDNSESDSNKNKNEDKNRHERSDAPTSASELSLANTHETSNSTCSVQDREPPPQETGDLYPIPSSGPIHVRQDSNTSLASNTEPVAQTIERDEEIFQMDEDINNAARQAPRRCPLGELKVDKEEDPEEMDTDTENEETASLRRLPSGKENYPMDEYQMRVAGRGRTPFEWDPDRAVEGGQNNERNSPDGVRERHGERGHSSSHVAGTVPPPNSAEEQHQGNQPERIMCEEIPRTNEGWRLRHERNRPGSDPWRERSAAMKDLDSD